MLNKILKGWLVKASNNDEKTKVDNLQKHEQASLYVEKIIARASSSRPFNPIRASGVFLQTIKVDIVTLTDLINAYAEKLELQDNLTQKDCYAELKTVTLDNFFTDKDGMYIPLSEFNTFLESCRRLFIVVDRGLKRKDANMVYSVRMLSKCFTSIQSVCMAVDEASI